MEFAKSGLIIAAQPTLDRTVIIENFNSGETYRLESVTRLPSGKANNVARCLHFLGFPINVIALLGGFIGQWIFKELSALGIQVSPIWVKGENRIAYSIYDPSDKKLTQLIENYDGPISDKDWDVLKDLVIRYLHKSSCFILSGRASTGFPDTGYQELIQIANDHSIPTYLDCYGTLLGNALKSKPTVIKINSHEAENLLDCEILSARQCHQAAIKLLEFGVKKVVITRGEKGAVAVDHNESWLAVPPILEGVNVGSGDAFMAGFIFGIENNFTFKDSLRYGVAAGSANVLIPGAGLFNKTEMMKIKNQVKIRSIR